jgi:hypothetical protein
MPAEPTGNQPAARRCPVCWTGFTLTPRNANKRYCCGACRMEDWRRRHDAERAAAICQATLADIRAANATEAERREALRLRHALEEWRSTMNPD